MSTNNNNATTQSTANDPILLDKQPNLYKDSGKLIYTSRIPRMENGTNDFARDSEGKVIMDDVKFSFMLTDVDKKGKPVVHKDADGDFVIVDFLTKPKNVLVQDNADAPVRREMYQTFSESTHRSARWVAAALRRKLAINKALDAHRAKRAA